MHWNTRIVKATDEFGTTYQFAEVHYEDDGRLIGYFSPCMLSETFDGLRDVLRYLQHALDKPVIDESEFYSPNKG